MQRPMCALAALCLTTVGAQNPAPEKTDPVLLVGQAEKLLQKKEREVEDAVLLLWQALDQIAATPSNPVQDATWLSARFLLQENDAREAERRRVFTAVAKQQVELAAAYRTKKWFDTAANRLEVADRHDRDAGTKEHGLLDAARPKAAAPGAAPSPQICPLLQKSHTQLTSGEWRVVGDALECQAPNGQVLEWVTTDKHEDNEVVVEFRANEPRKMHNATLAVGLGIVETSGNFSGYRFQCDYYPETNQYGLICWQIRGMSFDNVGNIFLPPLPPTDGYHRLSVQVRGNRMRARLDTAEALEVKAASPVRGFVGLTQGVSGADTCAVRFRNLRVDPLPPDQASDEDAHANAAAENQAAITKAVDSAKLLLTQKQPEAAALRLRDALGRLEAMSAGVLRDNLRKAIEPMLAQADPLAPKRKKAALDGAAELAGLANQYATAGMVRAALVLATRAASFDGEGQAANVAALRDKVQQWNIAQATAHAAELEPPSDDGAKLREWFEKGRRLDTGCPGFVIEGPVASVELGADAMATWLPQPPTRPLQKASLHVHLPATGAIAGLYFDVVDSTQNGLVTLVRRSNGLRLAAYSKVANKWVPLLQRDIAIDAWRLDAWHQIAVEATESGLVARCGAVEIKVPRKQLGRMTGEVGLFAQNAGKEPMTIEVRAFQPGQ